MKKVYRLFFSSTWISDLIHSKSKDRSLSSKSDRERISRIATSVSFLYKITRTIVFFPQSPHTYSTRKWKRLGRSRENTWNCNVYNFFSDLSFRTTQFARQTCSNQLGNDLVQINLVSVEERGILPRTVATDTPRQRTYMSTGLMETEKDRRVEDADSVAIRKVRHRQGRAEWKQPAAFLRFDRYEAFTCRVAPWADDDIRTVQFSPLIIYPLDYRSPLSTTASRRSYRSQPVSSPTLTDPTTHIS